MEYVVGYNYRKGLKVQLNEHSSAEARQKSTVEIREPGDLVPEVKAWKPHILKAHLNLGRVQTQAEYDAMKAQYEPEEPAEVEETVDDFPEEVDEPEEVSEDEDMDLASLPNSRLRELCKERGLPVYGKKDVLLARLGG